MKILLFGWNGYIGSNFADMKHEVYHPDFRLEDIEKNKEYLNTFDCIINCAGKVNQDGAEIDEKYRLEMYRANAFLAIELGEVFKGYIVHISSPFVHEPELSHYSRAKYMSHLYYATRKNSLILVPACPYGGDGANGFRSFLKNRMFKQLTIDNKIKFNGIHMEDFWKESFKLIDNKETGVYLIYEEEIITKYDLAVRMYGEKKNWVAGEFTGDLAKRPLDWTMNNIYSIDHIVESKHIVIGR